MTKNALRLASHQMTFKPLLCVLALGVSSGAAMAASPNSALLAHRAVYDLELGQTTGNSAPSNARGRIVFEFSGSACEGYVTTFRQITEISLQENQGRISDMRTSTFEDGDGKNFASRPTLWWMGDNPKALMVLLIVPTMGLCL